MTETATQKSLQGKKILVTGGSRGIGASIVRSLAGRGASVAFTYTSRPDAANQVLEGLPGTGHFCLSCDIANEESVNAMAAQVLERMGEVDGIVNNAGITQDTLLLRMKTEDFERVVDTNLKGTFLVTRAFLKSMVKARKGSVVNITSVIGQTGNAGQANYAASKAGTEGFTKSLALEVASRGIRANCVAPGFIQTEMTDILTEDQKNGILNKIPLGRIAHAEEVASAVAFLLSDDSSYITGHTLSVNGGLFMN